MQTFDAKEILQASLGPLGGPAGTPYGLFGSYGQYSAGAYFSTSDYYDGAQQYDPKQFFHPERILREGVV